MSQQLREEGNNIEKQKIPKFQFSTDTANLSRVQKIHLELVNFTSKIQLHDGSIYHLNDLHSIQTVLDHASEFNKDKANDDEKVIVDIQLDPKLNDSNNSSYHIPA